MVIIEGVVAKYGVMSRHNIFLELRDMSLESAEMWGTLPFIT